MALHGFPPGGFDPITIDGPDAEEIATCVFNGLVSYDEKSKTYKPELAKSWTTSSNLKVWTFALRSGVKFQDGYGKMTADDVVFSFKRAQSDASTYSSAFDNVASFAAPDPNTVKITLKAPDADFLANLTNLHQGQVVSKAAVTKLGKGFANHPVGTGPYEVTSYDPAAKRVVLQRFDGYYGGKASLRELDFTAIDQHAAAIALQNGELDLIINLQGGPEAGQLEDAGFKLNAATEADVLAMRLNTKTQPAFANQSVRQAMFLAVDHAALSKLYAPVSGPPPVNLVPTYVPSYTSDVPRYNYNPDKAKQLLDQAGYGNGLTVKYMVRGVDGIDDADLLEQEMLGKVGIKVVFDPVDPAEFSKRGFNGDFQMALSNITQSTVDLTLRSILDPAAEPPNGSNSAYYDNPKVMQLLNQARATADKSKRQQLYTQVQQIVMTDLPYIPERTNRPIWPSTTKLQFDFNVGRYSNFFDAKLSS